MNLRRIGKWFAVILLCFAVLRLAMRISPNFRSVVYKVQDNVIMARLFPITSKFWAHRCNDTRKMEEMMAIYSGVELDIIFCPLSEGSVFETSHDLQPTIEHPLNDFFARLTPPQETKIWLDFKNLNETTAQPALQELEKLVTTYQIDKKRLIVESANYTCLGLFHQQGYYTSFYCPVNDDRYLLTTEHKEEFVRLVNNAVQSGHVNAVSFPVSYYPLIKEAGIKIDLLTWHHLGYWWECYLNRKLNSVMKDEQVKVILVSAHSRYDR